MIARLDAHAVEPVRERLVDDLVDERRLARARHSGDADQLADREVHVDAFEVVHARPWTEKAPVVDPPFGNGNSTRAREELPRDRSGRLLDLPGRPCATTRPPCSPARPHVDEMIGGAHHLLVVLHDKDGVADVAEALERVDQPVVVTLVEADRRLVEDVEDADQLRSDLRRETAAAPRLRRGSKRPGRAADSRHRRCRGTRAARGSPSGCAAMWSSRSG